jgi:hypothetical protein
LRPESSAYLGELERWKITACGDDQYERNDSMPIILGKKIKRESIQLRRDGIEDVLAGPQRPAYGLLSPIEQILRLEDHPSPLAANFSESILGARTDPLSRLFARLRRKQDRESHSDSKSQEQTSEPTNIHRILRSGRALRLVLEWLSIFAAMMTGVHV